jgi:hypothetical protein
MMNAPVVKKRMSFWLMAVLVLALSGAAYGGETVLQLRTVEVPGMIVDDSICAESGFTPNVRLYAHVWSQQTRAADGMVVNDQIRDIGLARACVQITDFTFSPFVNPARFYIRFDLESGVFTGLGSCTIMSNNIPEPGLILAGCNLTLGERSDGVSRPVGSAVSSSVFNPFQRPGYNTGSFWTLRMY